MKAARQEIQSALEFLRACSERRLSEDLADEGFAALDENGLAALAKSNGYDVGGEALAEAFRIRMSTRLLSRRVGGR